MSTLTTKEHARELVDRLEPPQVEPGVRFLEEMVNGMSLSEEYRSAFDKAEAYLDSGAASEVPAESVAVPKKRHRQDESEWMATHQDELNAHRGEWVVIEGSQMIAADPDYLTARNRAVAAGITVPLIFQVPENDLPFAGF